jgi:pimeloyl-ACP methyl ester carboxylesterase
VIFIDLRGTGRSSIEEQEVFTFNDLANDVIAVLDHLKIVKCHVLGISMGGRVVQSLVTSKGDRIEKAILVSSLCKTKSYPVHQSFRQMTSKEFIHFFLPRFFTPHFAKDNPLLVKEFCTRAEKFKTPFTTYELQLDAIKQFQGCEALRQVNHEILIIHGQLDSFIPVKHAYQLQSVLKKSVLHIFPDEGHFLFDTEELEEKTTLVINFLLSNTTKYE